MDKLLTRRWSRVGILTAAAVAFGGMTMGTSYAADDATVFIVQGLPGKTLDIEVDGKTVAENVKTAGVTDAIKVKAGSRKITFNDGGDTVAESTFSVKAKSSTDLVVHLPAAADEDPVVTVFRNDLDRVAEEQGLAGGRAHRVGPARRHPGQRRRAVREHRQRRVVEADGSRCDVQGGHRADRRDRSRSSSARSA